MTLGQDVARGARPSRFWALRVVHWGGLALALVDCRTPPPIARTPDDPPEARALVPDDAPAPPEPHSPATRAEPEPAPPPPDYSADQHALVERYARRRSQGVLRGEASYYGKAFAGRKTASGEVFEPERFTAAHRTLPFGTVLRVTRLDTRAIVYVKVNDRGPFGKSRRILDLSTAAAAALDMLSRGVAEIRADIVERGVAPPPRRRRARRAH